MGSCLLQAEREIHEKIRLIKIIKVASFFIVDNLKFSGGGSVFNRKNHRFAPPNFHKIIA